MAACSGFFTIDMTIGAVILGIWQYFNAADALVTAPLVASALIAGDGVWSVPSAVLALAKVSPPMCAAVSITFYLPSSRRILSINKYNTIVIIIPNYN